MFHEEGNAFAFVSPQANNHQKKSSKFFDFDYFYAFDYFNLLFHLLSSQLFAFFLKGKLNALVKLSYLTWFRVLCLSHAVMKSDIPTNHVKYASVNE